MATRCSQDPLLSTPANTLRCLDFRWNNVRGSSTNVHSLGNHTSWIYSLLKNLARSWPGIEQCMCDILDPGEYRIHVAYYYYDLRAYIFR